MSAKGASDIMIFLVMIENRKVGLLKTVYEFVLFMARASKETALPTNVHFVCFTKSRILL